MRANPKISNSALSPIHPPVFVHPPKPIKHKSDIYNLLA